MKYSDANEIIKIPITFRFINVKPIIIKNIKTISDINLIYLIDKSITLSASNINIFSKLFLPSYKMNSKSL